MGISLKSQVWYLATPYTHPDPAIRAARAQMAEELSALLMLQLGVISWSPIAYYHAMSLRHDLPTDFEYWEEIDLSYLSRMGALIVGQMSGWQESKGVSAEIEFARDHGFPVVYARIDSDGCACVASEPFPYVA